LSWQGLIGNSIQQSIAGSHQMKKLTMLHKVASLVILSNLAGTATAHEFLSEILTQQSSSSNFVAVANYHLSQSEILAINGHGTHIDYIKDRSEKLIAIPRDPKLSCENSGSKTCGQFDHFSQARSAAVTTCYELGVQQSNVYPGELVPLYIGPTTFVDSDTASADHHLNYNLLDGLSFNCGYLELNNNANS